MKKNLSLFTLLTVLLIPVTSALSMQENAPTSSTKRCFQSIKQLICQPTRTTVVGSSLGLLGIAIASFYYIVKPRHLLTTEQINTLAQITPFMAEDNSLPFDKVIHDDANGNPLPLLPAEIQEHIVGYVIGINTDKIEEDVLIEDAPVTEETGEDAGSDQQAVQQTTQQPTPAPQQTFVTTAIHNGLNALAQTNPQAAAANPNVANIQQTAQNIAANIAPVIATPELTTPIASGMSKIEQEIAQATSLTQVEQLAVSMMHPQDMQATRVNKAFHNMVYSILQRKAESYQKETLALNAKKAAIWEAIKTFITEYGKTENLLSREHYLHEINKLRGKDWKDNAYIDLKIVRHSLV